MSAARAAGDLTRKVAAARQVMATCKQGGCTPLGQFLTIPVLLPVRATPQGCAGALNCTALPPPPPFPRQPTILSIFGAIHNTSMSEPTMATEGLLWFPDLISPDATSLLPILSALTWLWNVEMGAG
jgi:membrane protein insertase Oxa1/YidC/SpoIIIJ